MYQEAVSLEIFYEYCLSWLTKQDHTLNKQEFAIVKGRNF